MTPVDLSVLLVSWNTREETRACLDSLASTIKPGCRYEVIAVDNGSRDGSADLLAADPQVRLLRNDRNVGFAAAVNQAYRAATAPLVLLLNSDVRFHPGALDTMLDLLRDRPDIAGVSPLYLNPDGTFQQHYVQQPGLAAALGLVTVLWRLPGFRQARHRFEMRGEDFSRPRELASGSCMLLRRSILPAGRVFDERFPIYWNDALLARDLAAAGHRLWMLPDAVVTHTRGASCRLLGPTVRQRHLLGSMVGYLRETGPGYRIPLFRALVVADHLLKRMAGRPVTLAWPDLVAALRGDAGPLPDGDTREWFVHFSAEPWTGAAVPAPIAAQVAAGRRVLFVEPPGTRPRWPATVTGAAPSIWVARPATVLPFGDRSAAVDRFNRRAATAALRRWLDGFAGPRLLHLGDARARCVLGRLVEDGVVSHAHR
ncbi:glycosyltransferase family 2 protein [Dactylosporangium sp. CA-092794]|uniref:glycosyltransferase family 2 protein n=1 Tax=Dactylosporangium sp. CA-092794 TaxID=3239929 RepID=UPI003D91D5F8